MPAIYTFSLDYSRDRDIIDLLESKKNRSDYIRTILRKQMLEQLYIDCLLYTSPSPRDYAASRMPSSA